MNDIFLLLMLVYNYEFYYISVVTEAMVIKKGKTGYTHAPPGSSWCPPRGACTPV